MNLLQNHKRSLSAYRRNTLEGENAGTVTVRDRDTTNQSRISIDELIS